MSIVQTGYPNRHGLYVAGQVIDTTNCDIDSLELAGAASVPFGYAVQPGAGVRGVDLGASRQEAALLSADINASATTLAHDNVGHGTLQVGSYIVIDNEILYVSAVASATSATVARGALGSTAATHSDDAPISYFGSISLRGIAIMDERQQAARTGAFETGDEVPVLWRGDVAVPVSAAVSVDDQAVVTRTSATGDAVGSLSSRSPSGRHVAIPGGRFLTAAANTKIAVLRLSGFNPSNL